MSAHENGGPSRWLALPRVMCIQAQTHGTTWFAHAQAARLIVHVSYATAYR